MIKANSQQETFRVGKSGAVQCSHPADAHSLCKIHQTVRFGKINRFNTPLGLFLIESLFFPWTLPMFCLFSAGYETVLQRQIQRKNKCIANT